MLDARIPAALGASLILHGAALALVDRLPRGWPASAPDWGAWDAGALHARLRPQAEAVAEPAARAAAPLAGSRHDARAPGAAPAERGLATLPRYLPAEELDERPLIRTPVRPPFPELAPSSGRVVVRLHINEAGLVDDVKALRSEPPGVFEAAAIEAFRTARFTPGRKDGVAVKSALAVELLFGEAPPAHAQARLDDQPLWQPPRRSRSLRNPSTQEKP
jgi:protein TonB